MHLAVWLPDQSTQEASQHLSTLVCFYGKGRSLSLMRMRSPGVFPFPAGCFATVPYKAGILCDGDGKACNTVVREPDSPAWLKLLIRFGVLARVAAHQKLPCWNGA